MKGTIQSMQIEIVNRCPHGVTLIDSEGRPRTYEQVGPAVRIETEAGPAVGQASGVPIHAPSRITGITNLPPKRDGTVIVVSKLAAMVIGDRMPDRDDVVYPGSAPDEDAVRSADPRRRVLGVRRLVRATE
jgi:hypothetical protein